MGMCWSRNPNDLDGYHALSGNPWGTGKGDETNSTGGGCAKHCAATPEGRQCLAATVFPVRQSPTPAFPSAKLVFCASKKDDFYANLNSYVVQRENPNATKPGNRSQPAKKEKNREFKKALVQDLLNCPLCISIDLDKERFLANSGLWSTQGRRSSVPSQS